MVKGLWTPKHYTRSLLIVEHVIPKPCSLSCWFQSFHQLLNLVAQSSHLDTQLLATIFEN